MDADAVSESLKLDDEETVGEVDCVIADTVEIGEKVTVFVAIESVLETVVLLDGIAEIVTGDAD
jgi:hypothetical protein